MRKQRQSWAHLMRFWLILVNIFAAKVAIGNEKIVKSRKKTPSLCTE